MSAESMRQAVQTLVTYVTYTYNPFIDRTGKHISGNPDGPKGPADRDYDTS